MFQNVALVATPAACPNITKAVFGVNVLMPAAVTGLVVPILMLTAAVSIGLMVSTPEKLTIAAAAPVVAAPNENV